MHLQAYHLQAYPPAQRSPKRAQQGDVLRTSAVGYRGNAGGGARQPFTVLSNNTSHHHGNRPAHHHHHHGGGGGGGGGGVVAGSHGGNRRGNDKLLHPPPPASGPAPPCCHDDQEEAWSAVRPGYVREQIAMFAPPRPSEDPAFGPTGAVLKVKGGWEGESRSAKRPRRCRGGGLPPGGGQEQAVSVGKMVAFQRPSVQQVTSVPLLSLKRSSVSITLSRMPPGADPTPPIRTAPVEGSEVSAGAVRVWDLVARREAECVKSLPGLGRGLLRGVGRLLLAGTQSSSSSSSSPQPSPVRRGGSGSESEALALREAGETGQRPRGSRQDPAEPQTLSCGEEEEEQQEEEEEEEEEPPGKLFFSQLPVQTSSSRPPREPADGGSRPSEAPPPTSLLLLVRRSSPRGGEQPGSQRHAFLEARFKLQLLLEPQSSLLLLPQHLLLYILSLLPTHSLAALKCCCRHFSSFIEAYGVRPADSRWVGDPRYRDDPCKQCKRRYRRGDVSLCRWHHKPYSQALPYGPGQWVCCHSARRDSPGCNVGVHDNRWVPDIQSFTSPIYRRRREEPAEED